eukprot:s3355_g3.t1
MGKFIAGKFNENDSTRRKFAKVMLDLFALPEVMLDLFALPEVAECVRRKFDTTAPQVLTHVPVASRSGIYVHPFHLDMGENAKYGENGKWPSSVAIRTHFPSVVQRGYETEREPLEIKFPEGLFGTGKEVPHFSVQYIDGHGKAIMILAVFALLESLDTWYSI